MVKTALAVLKSNNVGDISKCMTTDPKEQESYCVKGYHEFEDVEECKNASNFCYSCCNNEFGVMKLTYRENCYHKACGGDIKYYAWKRVK